MEAAFMEQNRREFELTRHVSLALTDPMALVKLRETGRCFFRTPEELFDLDFPGHYFRRLKSVSLTIPCVTGPYTSVSCTLRLLRNSIRVNTTNGDNGYPHNVDDAGLPADDTRFIENNVPVKAVAVSHAQNDSGTFELNFRDERYLPFEGAGAVGEWALELFHDLPANNPDPADPDFGRALRQFDFTTITDAVLHLKYTAREDVGPFKNGAVSYLRGYFSEDDTARSVRMFDLRQEFPSQWHRFLYPANAAAGNVLDLDISPRLFRLVDNGKELKINSLALLARSEHSADYKVELTLPEAPPAAGDELMTLVRVNQFGALHFNQKDLVPWGTKLAAQGPAEKWNIRIRRDDGTNLQENPVTKQMELQDLYVVVGYDWD
jgi:hypothetical protein